MSAEHAPLPVVLCWHMHQPDYRGPQGGDYQLPWVYLHAIKDYVDMVAHLEAEEGARAVVNFAPVLLEQLADYGRQIQRWLRHGRRIRDPLLAALAGPALPLDEAAREALVRACLKANEKNLIGRFPPFAELVALARTALERRQTGYLNDRFLADLLVWYHLAWMGETVRRDDLRVTSLQAKARAFDVEDRRQLVTLIGEVVEGIVPRYRRLAESGRVELSVTPYAHPILPLLLDLESAREAIPDVVLPELKAYPGGEARSRWHIREGLATFERHFGFRPEGCWPAEGGVSEEALRLLEEEGFLWAASGQQVLHNSLKASGEGEELAVGWPHRPYRVLEGGMANFFRDDALSDLIGFIYGEWHADDAVANLLEHLERIEAATREQPDRIVSIIMDGENAWEYYPHNAIYFLPALYKALAEHPRLEMTTFSAHLRAAPRPPRSLEHLVAGSWVYGTFSTWIGERDKNRAWDMLGEAKQVYDRVMAEGRLDPGQVRKVAFQLATCEGSDWFWWFGDYNPGEAVSDFERLFRAQLVRLYEMLGEEPPEYLFEVFAAGSGRPDLGGVMIKN